MKTRYNNKGFSLTEVLMAVGLFTISMIFIAGVFPVAIHFTTVACERTVSAIVADEAFAKIKLYGIGFDLLSADSNECVGDFNSISYSDFNSIEYSYPSDPEIDISERKYYWSALFRRCEQDIGNPDPNNPRNRLVQVTVVK